MEFEASGSPYEQVDVHALAVAVFKDEKTSDSFLKQLDEKSGGLVKSAILGGNSARLYKLDVRSALGAITTDRMAAIKAEYVAAGGQRSNMRYGYVAPVRA